MLGRDDDPAVEGHVDADQRPVTGSGRSKRPTSCDRRLGCAAIAVDENRAGVIADVEAVVAIDHGVDAGEIAQRACGAHRAEHRGEALVLLVEGRDRLVRRRFVTALPGRRQVRQHGERVVVDLVDAVRAVRPHDAAAVGIGRRDEAAEMRGAEVHVVDLVGSQRARRIARPGDRRGVLLRRGAVRERIVRRRQIRVRGRGHLGGRGQRRNSQRDREPQRGADHRSAFPASALTAQS